MNQKGSPETILQKAVELSDAEERAAYLAEACGEDEELRHEVESLLAAHDAASDDFMDTLADHRWETQTEQPGDRIGRYKLLEPVGEGGFGRVWMAEQREPMQRRVALKIVKLGMDTGEVLGRFEAERQALAMMDHPNIAQVFDGGVTEKGRPYFVMELVKGVPITNYCDVNKLPPRERIDLFRKVCQAVQHAHQKGIIHRDLKPTNILVTVKDDKPVPKVIDFGVAKALETRLTERTLFTRMNQWIGTPAYMSPEQAGLGSLDIDTRSDVYSLGTVLYELLTGRTPFDQEELRKEGYEAILRKIREEDAPKASTRLSTLTREELTTIAVHRGRTPDKLGHAIKGELDWILLKALERDRTRRYDTANALAADLQRYANGEPITAAPPTFAYQAGKFFRKRWKFASIAAAFVAVLIAGTGVSIQQAVKADIARQDEKVQREEAVRLREEAVEDANLLRTEREQNRRIASKRHLDLARMNMERGNYSPAVAHLCQANRDDPNNTMARTLLLSTLLYGAEKLPARPVSVIEASISDQAEFTPDGKTLVALDQKGLLHAWETESGKRLFDALQVFPDPGSNDRVDHTLTLSEDGGSVAVSMAVTSTPAEGSETNEYQIRIVDLLRGRAQSSLFTVENRAGAFPHSVGSRWELGVIGQGNPWTMTVYDPEAQKQLRKLKYPAADVDHNADLVWFAEEGKLLVHDLWSGEPRFPAVDLPPGGSGTPSAVAMTNAGRLLVTWKCESDPVSRRMSPTKSETPTYRTQIYERGEPPVVTQEFEHSSEDLWTLPNECGLIVNTSEGKMLVPERSGRAWDELPATWLQIPESVRKSEIQIINADRYLLGDTLWAGGRQASGVLPSKALTVNREGTRAVTRADSKTLCVYELAFPCALPEIREQPAHTVVLDHQQNRRIEMTPVGARFVSRSEGRELVTSVPHLGLFHSLVSPNWKYVSTLGVLNSGGEESVKLSSHLWKFPTGEPVPFPDGVRELETAGGMPLVTQFLSNETILIFPVTPEDGPTRVAVSNLRSGTTRELKLPGVDVDIDMALGWESHFLVAAEAGLTLFLDGQRVFRLELEADDPFHLLADLGRSISGAKLAPDGKTVVVLAENGVLSTIETETGEVLAEASFHIEDTSLYWYFGNDHVLFGSEALELLEVRTLRKVMSITSNFGESLAPPYLPGNHLGEAKKSRPGFLMAVEGGDDGDAVAGFQLWAALEGQYLTPPIATSHHALIVHQDEVLATSAMSLGFEGIDAETLGLRRWELPLLDAPLPDWFLDLADAYAALRHNEFGALEAVPAGTFLEIAKRMKTASISNTSRVDEIARWLVEPAPGRSVSPFFKCDRARYLEQLLGERSSAAGRDAAVLETGESARRLALLGRRTCVGGNWPLAEHYIKRALAIAPDDPEVRRIAEQVYLIVDPNRTRFPAAAEPKQEEE